MKILRFNNYSTDSLLHFSLRFLGVGCFSLYYHNRLGWFRFFGKGLKWKDTSIHGLMFSERNGSSKGLYIGKWRISYL